jgi:hypothetical protein
MSHNIHACLGISAGAVYGATGACRCSMQDIPHYVLKCLFLIRKRDHASSPSYMK